MSFLDFSAVYFYVTFFLDHFSGYILYIKVESGFIKTDQNKKGLVQSCFVTINIPTGLYFLLN